MSKSTSKSYKKVHNIVVISDTHIGSSLAIMPVGVTVNGEYVTMSVIQKQLHRFWNEFWDWTYARLNGEPFVLVHNGDVIDGEHHQSKENITNQFSVQVGMAEELLKPHVDKSVGFYCIRGTEAHSGKSAEYEEIIAKHLGAIKCEETGAYTRYQMFAELGNQLIDFSHHIGTSSAHAYKSSPAMRVMAASFATAGEWGLRVPNILIRGHSHDYVEVKRPNCRVVVCPSWQAKTAFVWRVDTAVTPVIGGLIIREGSEGVHIREKIFTVKRPDAVTI
jgi:UDP-2,3-diacylglucosamine pyrophosphatase LpxH